MILSEGSRERASLSANKGVNQLAMRFTPFVISEIFVTLEKLIAFPLL